MGTSQAALESIILVWRVLHATDMVTSLAVFGIDHAQMIIEIVKLWKNIWSVQNNMEELVLHLTVIWTLEELNNCLKLFFNVLMVFVFHF